MANAHLRVLSTRETARRLGVTMGSVRRLALAGELVGRKIGERAWGFDKDDVEAYLRRRDQGESKGGRPRRGGPEDE